MRGETGSRTRARRGVTIGALGVALLLGVTGTGLAVPPPPPNPSDSEIDSSKAEANAKAGDVGRLTNQLAQAESKLSQLNDEVELKMEEANKARVDAETAQDAAAQADREARSARTESDAAQAAIDNARADLDKFAAASFQQGSTVGSVSAYLTADSPKELLGRAQLLDAVGGSRLNALDTMKRAQTEKANKDATARKKLEIAQERKREAEAAKHEADNAQSAAQHAQDTQATQNVLLEADKANVEKQLFEAQQKVNGLQGQRQRYEDWKAQKAREDEERARQAALAASKPSEGGGGRPSGRPVQPAPAGASVEAVVQRALSQLGLPYAWGGGNTSGPTRGIRDGGTADRYGDYMKTGFDCSGLMIFAFAGVRALPHYSGYQYDAGRKVPLSQMRRGDMLFWGGSARGIHHVAMYLGNGQMVEAPQSGLRVRIAPVRYGGIMPYATRLIG
ncbi:NlpC/P60 family protein [Amycolatopsis regifaucium]|uniref:Hydrolase n=1 Tax=Amycolatopsis regifaucium TaxID=546365 RepID=A0A154MUX6_9PSEU|nr:NlpC/P60 family protein [Amycolatopsis regifaucium]KZB88148.1 hydrolase [Amycolatopsis regifaucium]OKA04351.1 hydrolase [Amycolatopsis regifaucium]SFH47180.1 Cell wall-associated hydrolase, NlpC family [Amycolatopsis regifaucium]